MHRPRPGDVYRDVGAAVTAATVCALPAFLVGTLAVQLRESLHFGASALGAAVTLAYLGAAMASVPLGGFADKVGGLRAMRLACALSAVVLLLIAAVADSWLLLALLMLPAGVANAGVQPAANLFLVRRIPQERLGLAFGFKQAAIPLATAISGIAVPVLALTVGWRWAFAVAAGLAVVTATMLPRPRQRLAERRAARAAQSAGPLRRRPLIVLSIGFGMGVGAATALTAFLVSSAVASGAGRGPAGLLATLGGVMAVASRVIAGRRADRRGGAHLPVVAAMLVVGALGYAGLALAASRQVLPFYLGAVVVVFAAGWGWNGLFNFAIVRTHTEQAGAATGFVQTGGRLGSTVTPFIFGQIVTHTSYAVAWLFAAALSLCAAGTILLGHSLLQASRKGGHSATAPPAAAESRT